MTDEQQKRRAGEHAGIPHAHLPERVGPKAERLAAEVARRTGETKTEAVTTVLRERLERLRRKRAIRRLADDLEAIADHCARLPLLDPRTADDILDYDDRGLPP